MISHRFIERHLLRRSGLSYMLSPLSFVFSTLQTIRRKLPRPDAWRAPCKVVSIGNISSGGSGKTPLTIHLARKLTERGYQVAVSHRGYRGAFEESPHLISDETGLLYSPRQCGDEAWLIAQRLPGIPVAVGKDRKAAIKLILEIHPETSVIIMDDGFQHLRVRRDVDIVCFDADTGLGNGWLIPAGYLREPVRALKHAHFAVISRKHPKADVTLLKGHLGLMDGRSYVCDYRITSGRDADGKEIPLAGITGERCVLVSGIANPQALFETSVSLGLDVAQHFAFPDHYGFGDQKAVSGIISYCKDKDIKRIVCTEKDIMKLCRYQSIRPMLAGLALDLDCPEEDALLDGVIQRISGAGLS